MKKNKDRMLTICDECGIELWLYHKEKSTTTGQPLTIDKANGGVHHLGGCDCLNNQIKRSKAERDDWESRFLATARENMHLRAACQYVVDNLGKDSIGHVGRYVQKVLHELDNQKEQP